MDIELYMDDIAINDGEMRYDLIDAYGEHWVETTIGEGWTLRQMWQQFILPDLIESDPNKD